MVFNRDRNNNSEQDDRIFEYDSIWDYIFGAFEGEKLVSTYISFYLDVKVRGKFIKSSYMDGVATVPNYRNRGIIRELIYKDFERLYKEGIKLLFLDPFKHSYYKKFGFELSFNRERLKVPFEFISNTLKETNCVSKMDYIKENKQLQKDIKTCSKILVEKTPYNAFLNPKPYSELEFHDKNQQAVVVYENGVPKGYMIFNTNKDKKLEINKFYYSNLNVFYHLKRLLLSYRNQIKFIHFLNLPEDFPHDLLFDSYWKSRKYIERKYFLSRMMRIVDLENLLHEIVDLKKITRNLVLSVEDRAISVNNGVFEIGNSGVKRVNKKYDVKIKIKDFSPLISGYKSSIQLYKEGKIKVNNDNGKISIDERDIPKKIWLMNDIFPKKITFHQEF